LSGLLPNVDLGFVPDYQSLISTLDRYWISIININYEYRSWISILDIQNIPSKISTSDSARQKGKCRRKFGCMFAFKEELCLQQVQTCLLVNISQIRIFSHIKGPTFDGLLISW